MMYILKVMLSVSFCVLSTNNTVHALIHLITQRWPFIHHQPNLVLCLFSPSYLCGSFTPSPIQVYPDGIRHIRADKRVNEWKTPGKKTIVRCAVNQRQVVIALTGGELVYFEMDPVRK